MKDDGRWDSDASKEVPKKSLPRVEAFFDEYEALCRRMGLSLGHEDGHGAFEIGAFSEGDIEWARYAHLVGQPAIAADPTVPGRCATCRWAVASAPVDYDGEISGEASVYPDTFARYPLRCSRADAADGRDAYAIRKRLFPEPTNPAPMGAWSEGAFRGEMLVQPSFGCTEWQAKDDPAPETP